MRFVPNNLRGKGRARFPRSCTQFTIPSGFAQRIDKVGKFWVRHQLIRGLALVFLQFYVPDPELIGV